MAILDGGSQALAWRLAGTFSPTPDLSRVARLEDEVHQRAQRNRVLREDVSPGDVVLLLEA